MEASEGSVSQTETVSTPASADIYRDVRKRLRYLRDVNNIADVKRILDSITLEEIRAVGQRVCLLPLPSTKQESLSDQEVEAAARKAREWLYEMIECHSRVLDRENKARIFRFAVEKEHMDNEQKWSDMEKLYMALTNLNIPDAEERLKETFMMIFYLDFADHLADVSNMVAQRRESRDRALVMNIKSWEIRGIICNRSRNMMVDRFACSVRLASLQPEAGVVDENEGCCPICKDSYSDLSIKTAEELLADFPVRIKFCGHIMGKACLGLWMETPKIDEARYPDRLCPVCRVRIEGARAPPIPEELLKHVHSDQKSIDNLTNLIYDWDMNGVDECVETILSCMSDEIAHEELAALIKDRMHNTRWGFESEEAMLKEKMEKLRQEKWSWGFKGDAIWMPLREQWMNSMVRNG